MPISLALIVTLVLWLALRWLSRNGQRAALATSLLIALFFAFNQCLVVLDTILEKLSQFWVHTGYWEHPWFLLVILLVGAVPALDLIFRRLKNPVLWSNYLNVFALILVLLPASNAAMARIREPAKPIIRAEGGIPLTAKPGRLPDIYYIILDAYARSDVMKDLFGFNNAPFLDRLEQKGFFVARESRANYCQTPLSLCSTLNCDYLKTLIAPSTRDRDPLAVLIRDNLVVKSLRPLGYQFVAFASGYDVTECPQADRFLGPRHPADNFQMLVVRMTPLRYLPLKIDSWDFYTSIRERTLFTLDNLSEVAHDKEPTFTFAHILSPHHPFVFGENGEDVSPRAGNDIDAGGRRSRNLANSLAYREGYRKQAIYLTKRVEQAIDQILAKSPEPPIIILQSDHGSGLRHHLNDLERTDLRERMSILNCYYFPNRNYEGLTPRITPVNSFRVAFNNNFGGKLPILENRNQFSTYDEPFEFVDVTGRLDSGQDRGRKYTPPDIYPGMVH
ncbi:hypothetical protein Sinac_7569 (plasmid) [Singulisphaera acidiphila DSM 18658]|uniref:Sulfatase N-terminal domain-containing protein n=1 Tax=Singulisphaera acidiphila (strain ATCC BAA-1392 / DSM 18658 / VKM B-2454 / MOB10) TaxID=886293 RepID=L0DTA8_SINAD|nr:hypothetical protein Sinac_7569 [Singulisphaera acidiphila DSM 18658]